MKKRVLAAIETDAFALSSSTAPHERRQPVSGDCGEHPRKLQTRRSAALRWLVDSLAFAGGGMAGVHVGVWLDPPEGSVNQTGRIDETSPRQRGVATDRHDADPWPFD